MPSTRARAVIAVRLAVKPVGKPDAGNPHVRFDERGRETGCCHMAQATAPVLDSTNEGSPPSRALSLCPLEKQIVSLRLGTVPGVRRVQTPEQKRSAHKALKRHCGPRCGRGEI